MTDADLDAEIQRGLDDVTAGRTSPCPKQAFPDPIALKGDLPSLDDLDAAKKAGQVARQKAAVMKFAGCWKDDRTTEEIIKDIEGHRTKGREVNL